MDGDLKRSCVRSYVDHAKIRELQIDLGLKDYDTLSTTPSIFSNATRLKILDCLSKTNELCVCDLSDILDMDVSAISHQLRKLKDRGFVQNRRDGLTIYYSIAPTDQCQQACEMIDELMVESRERRGAKI